MSIYGKGKGYTPIERFSSKVTVTNGCWQWEGAKARKGYGVFWHKGRNIAAHRFSYELIVSPIPKGLVLDHLCRNHSCVNPAHLEPVTHHENVRRGYADYNRLKTHCKQGHPFDEANTYWKSNGGRDCRTCNKLRSRRVYSCG